MLKKYALIVDNDVFHTMRFDDEHPTAAKWIAALDTGLTFINIKDYFSVRPGFHFDGLNFYLPEDSKMITPIEKDINSDIKISKYAGLVNNEVIGIFTAELDETQPFLYEMIIAGMASNPIIVDCTNDSRSTEITYGWTYIDNKFNEPGQ